MLAGGAARGVAGRVAPPELGRLDTWTSELRHAALFRPPAEQWNSGVEQSPASQDSAATTLGTSPLTATFRATLRTKLTPFF